MEPKSKASEIMRMLKSPIRRDVLHFLRKHKDGLHYMELINGVGLHHIFHAGKFVYHLNLLTENGLVEENKMGRYFITGLGNSCYNFMMRIDDYAKSEEYKRGLREGLEKINILGDGMVVLECLGKLEGSTNIMNLKREIEASKGLLYSYISVHHHLGRLKTAGYASKDNHKYSITDVGKKLLEKS